MGEKDFSALVRQVGPQKVVQAIEKVVPMDSAGGFDFPDAAIDQVIGGNGDHPQDDESPPPKPQQKEAPVQPATLVERYGPFAFRNKEGQISSISQAFWGGLFADENIVLYEPAEKQFYLYEEGSGLYVSTTEAKIRSTIAERMLQAAREWEIPALARFRTTRDLSGIISHLEGMTEQKDAFSQERTFIHVANGIVEFEDSEFKLLPFSSEKRSRNASPIKYKENAKCPRFTGELLAPLTASDQELIQKMFGQMVFGKNLTQRFLILDGEADAGKTQLALVIKEVIGQTNCAQMRTKQLEERFELARFLNRTLLLGVDVAANFLSTPAARVIKGLVGGDLMDAERKTSNNVFQFLGTLNCLITSNSRQRVRLEGDEAAWRRRMLIVRYTTPRAGKKIPDFYKVLMKEAGSGILNWALEGYKKLKKDIDFHGDILVDDAHRDIIDSLMSESDSLRLFAISELQSTPGHDLTTEEIVKAYLEYCRTQQWDMVPLSKIEKMLPDIMSDLFGVLKSHDIVRGDKKALRGYSRIQFRPLSDPDPDF
jgi:P4 family phage/plasmid primase-like protien